MSDGTTSTGQLPRRWVLGGMSALAADVLGAVPKVVPPAQHPVIELRQYKIVAGKRDALVDLFETHFIEPQEALGMRLVGQFRDQDDPDRFVWLRQFSGMSARAKRLNHFYTGPVWKAHRAEANALLEDNDNVLLLRPATPASGFAPPTSPRPEGAEPGAAGLVVAHVLHLWKDPAEGFAAFFDSELRPAYEGVGLPVLGAFVREPSANNFPRLPVREGEKVFVWFTRVAEPAALDDATRRLDAWPGWSALRARLEDHLERAPQVLRLAPTPRSRLR